MTRNDNLHNNRTDSKENKTLNICVYSCKLTALELITLPAVNGVYFMSLFIQR